MRDFNISEFQTQVSQIVQQYMGSETGYGLRGDKPVASSQGRKAKDSLGLNEDLLIITLTGTDIPILEVKDALQDKKIKKHLCPVLKSFSSDALEISKLITPILVSLSLAGVIQLALNPMIFAGIAIVIARMGIAALCADIDAK